LDLVSMLVNSCDYRTKLLQIVSSLNMSEDAKVREALRKDEPEIAQMFAEVLRGISRSETLKATVFALEGDDAQKFSDVVQDILEKGYLCHEESIRARRLLVRFFETCDKLPSSLFIKGVERPDDHATFGGGFGDVFKAYLRADGRCVALKRMRTFQQHSDLLNIRRRFGKEALLWRHLNNKFIVPFLGIDAETFPLSLCLVSPWMRHGTVLKHIADHGKSGIDKRLHEVAQGLAYLHSQKIVHGDLRGANILINDEWQACLTDFGLTVFNDATASSSTSRRGGSVRWMAPELHIPESFGMSSSRLTPETDVYAFGCVCLEVGLDHCSL
ncbi:kinase-like protein, partial [Dendrothele bispora CBS 962.96]